MKRILALILILGIIMGGVGCIQKEGNAILLSFGNETYTFTLPENQTNTTTPGYYTYERYVDVGKVLIIEEPNITIKVEYEVREGKFGFFVTYKGETNLYYEPMDIELDGIKIHGEAYWVGTTIKTAKILIKSPRKLTLLIKEVSQ
ncbi:hypothetical protein [Pyrococcus kukulkanii]|uniref:hypothetical protein n=1 Tax=Pyrococcus kukulkanii TaxID=1609559 RepID=UPI003564AF49